MESRVRIFGAAAVVSHRESARSENVLNGKDTCVLSVEGSDSE